MKEERGEWEEAIRSKLHDYELDTNPEDWNIIAGRLSSGGKTVQINPYRRYGYAAAAAVATLLIVGSLYFYLYRDNQSNILTVVEKADQPVESNDLKIAENETYTSDDIVDNVVDNPINHLAAIDLKQENNVPLEEAAEESPVQLRPFLIEERELEQIQEPDSDVQRIENEISEGWQNIDINPEKQISDKPLVAAVSTEKKHSRWGFGMGGGGYAVSATSGGLPVMTASKPLKEEDYMHGMEMVTTKNTALNALLAEPVDSKSDRLADINSGKVKHKTPVSGGLGVSYYLTDRWTLHSGVVYTLLRSKGTYYDDVANPVDWKQNLHYLGVPLSVSCSIAEWNRIHFYVLAGGMGELNVAGKFKQVASAENLESVINENVRMKEPLWSVNTRAGAVYPVWRFINVYAEAGASYYFDNHSEIKTIRSSKPFNVSLQTGIRLGF